MKILFWSKAFHSCTIRQLGKTEKGEDDLQLKSKASLKPIKHPLNIMFNLNPLIQSAADQQLNHSY